MIYRGPHKTVNEIDIVDHQIKHDTDIQGARFEGRNSMRLNELWFFNVFRERNHDGIEPLEVSDLDAARDRMRNELTERVPGLAVDFIFTTDEKWAWSPQPT